MSPADLSLRGAFGASRTPAAQPKSTNHPLPSGRFNDYRMLFFAGIFLSLLGSLPPGLISLSVAHTAIRHGAIPAFLLACGAAFAEFFQAWAAVELSDWLMANSWMEHVFQWAATVIFAVIGIYLFWFAPAPTASEVPTQSVHRLRYFSNGILLSAFNLMAIPYWFVYCGWLRVAGWWQDGRLSTFVFSVGVSVGTLGALMLYARLGLAVIHRSAQIARKANQIVAAIFFLLSIRLLLRLLGIA